jgi:hypothetical protein
MSITPPWESGSVAPLTPAPPPPPKRQAAAGWEPSVPPAKKPSPPKPIGSGWGRPPRAEVGEFKKGNFLTSVIQDPQDLIDCFDEYELDCFDEGRPINLNGFLAFAVRPLGITRRWWGRQSRQDHDCSKLPGLKEAIEAIETRIAGHLDDSGLAGKIQPAMASNALKILDDRDQLAVEKAAVAAAAKYEVPQYQIANLFHPDMTHEQLAELERLGLKPILYSQQQLEAGFPLILPTRKVE